VPQPAGPRDPLVAGAAASGSGRKMMDTSFVRDDTLELLHMIGSASPPQLQQAVAALPTDVLRRLLVSMAKSLSPDETRQWHASLSGLHHQTASRAAPVSGSVRTAASSSGFRVPYDVWCKILQYLDVGTMWFGA
jgi:hypothetical protein